MRYSKEEIKEVLSEVLKIRRETLVKLHFDVFFLLKRYPKLDDELRQAKHELGMLQIMEGQKQDTKHKVKALTLDKRKKELEMASDNLVRWREGIEFNEEMVRVLEEVIKKPNKII